MHTSNPSTWEAEAGGSLNSSSAWFTDRVPGQPCLNPRSPKETHELTWCWEHSHSANECDRWMIRRAATFICFCHVPGSHAKHLIRVLIQHSQQSSGIATVEESNNNDGNYHAGSSRSISFAYHSDLMSQVPSLVFPLARGRNRGLETLQNLWKALGGESVIQYQRLGSCLPFVIACK